MTEFTAEELYDEALRHIDEQILIYARRVANGTMTQQAAERRIAMMRAIADLLAKLAEKDRLL